MKTKIPKYPKIKVKLAGMDGNAFMLMGLVCRGLREGGVPGAEIKQFCDGAVTGDYDNFLQTCMKWVNES